MTSLARARSSKSEDYVLAAATHGPNIRDTHAKGRNPEVLLLPSLPYRGSDPNRLSIMARQRQTSREVGAAGFQPATSRA